MPVFIPNCPLSRDERTRVGLHAKALSLKTKPGKHYGRLTAKFLDVLEALLGLGAPATERTIAARADCCRATVFQAIKALQAAGILTVEARGRAFRTIVFIVPRHFGR